MSRSSPQTGHDNADFAYRPLATTLTVWIVITVALGFGAFLVMDVLWKTNHARQTAALGLLAMIAVALLLRWLMGRLVARPLRLVLQTVDELGMGKLQTRVPPLPNNEIGWLAARINHMATRCEQADAALRASEARYRHTIDQAIDAIFMIDPETGRILDVNQEAERLTRYTRSELERMFVWDLHPPEARERARQMWERIRDEGVSLSAEIEHLRKTGPPFIAGISSGIIRYGDTRVIQRIARDLTEQKRLAEKQRHLELELLQQAKLSAIGSVAQGVAHNLRGPLTAILGYAELLQKVHPALHELDYIITSGRQMNDIIHNIMVKSRNDQESRRVPLNLNDLLRSELQFLEADLYFKHHIEKEYRFAEDLPVFEAVYSDFSQSLMNIVRNAVDAMHDRPQKKLTVETDYDDETVFVRIADTGCGIPREHLSKIFEPFFTTKPAVGAQRSGEPFGTGLGLSSCLQLIQPYGAKVEVQSEVGKGSTFTIRIPRVPTTPRESGRLQSQMTGAPIP